MRERAQRLAALLLAGLALPMLVGIDGRGVGAPGREPGPASGASTQPAASSICALACSECEPGRGPFDLACAACRTQVNLCEAKLALYHAHMEELGAGVELFSLPDPYRRVLARFYPRLDLGRVRVGASDRQPPDNAITDCDRIYFARTDFVERLRTRELRSSSDWLWLLHELRHAEQCALLGGRDAYAVRWLDELGLTFLSDADLATLHERIPMEGDADARAEGVLAELSACCRAEDGRLRAPEERGVAAPPPAPER